MHQRHQGNSILASTSSNGIMSTSRVEKIVIEELDRIRVDVTLKVRQIALQSCRRRQRNGAAIH